MRRANRKGVKQFPSTDAASVAVKVAAIAVLALSGCSPKADWEIALTPTAVRAARRAYDGAPPVIPHPPQGVSCASCHTTTGMEVPGQGFAPANPHTGTAVDGSVANCRQCHVFARTTDLFAESSFAGLAQAFGRGERMYSGGPPVIPHQIMMRENCNTCHSGPAARPEIRCSHPNRTHCRQCHLENTMSDNGTSASSGELLSGAAGRMLRTQVQRSHVVDNTKRGHLSVLVEGSPAIGSWSSQRNHEH